MSNKFDLPLCEEFEDWLIKQGYDEATIRNRISNVAKINAAYGNLLDHWEKDGLESVLEDLAYSKKDAHTEVANPSKIAIDGNIYDGLATYRSALRLYIAFLTANPALAKRYLTRIQTIIAKAVNTIAPTVKNKELNRMGTVDKLIIEPLVRELSAELDAYGYTFQAEETASEASITIGGKTRVLRDRYDIVGTSSTGPLIIIEVDTHRSDQLTKKMVSRIALNSDKELIYISILYPNNHVNKDAERRECEKYVNYISTLFSLFGHPQKHYFNYLLF